MVRVIPNDVLIRDPQDFMRVVPVEGKVVELSAYWLRLEAAGDVRIVEICDDPAPAEMTEPAQGGKPGPRRRK